MPSIGLVSGRPLRLLAVLAFVTAIVAIVAFVWIRVALTLTKTVEPARPIGTPSALGWGDRVFTSKAQLRAFLEGRGISYSSWARRHPSAIAVLEHRRPVVRSSKPAPAPSKAHSTSASRGVGAAHSAGTFATRLGRRLLAILPWLGVLALVGLVATPPRIVWAYTGVELTPERRVTAGAVAAVLALGLIVARV